MAALVEDEQELGAACIDLGAGATGISIFTRRHLIYADAVPLGGANVTRDISQGLHVCQATAETLKVRHGGLFATSKCDRDMAEIGGTTGDWETDRRRVSKAEIIGIMRPRVEEILEDVRDRLDAAGFDCLPSQRVVLTGGASETPGIEGLAQRILGRPVRLGRPMRVQGLPLANASAAHASVVGLALHAVHPQDECWDFKMPFDGRGAKRLRRALRWFRDNW